MSSLAKPTAKTFNANWHFQEAPDFVQGEKKYTKLILKYQYSLFQVNCIVHF
jgi:hypothetical protein